MAVANGNTAANEIIPTATAKALADGLTCRSHNHFPQRGPTMTPFDFNQKAALVTGGNSGIGAAVVELLTELGAEVCVADINVGDDAHFLQGDVSSEADVSRMTAAALEQLGSIDILVNCAGIADTNMPTVAQQPGTWQRIVNVNLIGTLLMCQAVGAHMVQRRRGAIINISSVTGLDAFPRRNAYGASKAGVVMLTKSLASEWGGSGVRVNCVAPGYIRTPMVTALIEAGKIDVDRIQRRTPLARMGRPSEIAQAVAYLCSDWAAFVTGATLSVDGGWTAFGGAGDFATA
jgi:NAD(P)-dependent dehydrogenase (short-subunit alcohol dehydrogenase family)